MKSYPETETNYDRRNFLKIAGASLFSLASGCGGQVPNTNSSSSQSSTPGSVPPTPQPPPSPGAFVIPSTVPTTAEYSTIFGFNTLADVSNPGPEVQAEIIEQLKRGNRRIPIYLLGNVTPDGMDVGLNSNSGIQTVANIAFQPLLTMLRNIEIAGNLPPGFIRLTPYLRLSVTEEDTSPITNPNSPGKVLLSDNTIKTNVQVLIRQVADTGVDRFGLASRIQTEPTSPLSGYPAMGSGIVIDAEDILDPTYDADDLMNPADINSASATNIADLIQTMGGRNFEIFVYCIGIINQDWFPKATSLFAQSPKNLLSITAAQQIINAGAKLALAFYERFPDAVAHAAGLDTSDPSVIAQYGPYHTSYQDFVINQLQRLTNAGINLEEQHILLPAFQGSSLIPDGINAINDLEIARLAVAPTRKLLVEVFEGSNLLARPSQGIAGRPDILNAMHNNTR
ncbi:MAG: hypothetical protein P1V18_03460 [Candidatus Gracilibacteria bacterium]|nr:hypothetical protein [Candidatus Gracilibacteria bacterium]